MMYYSNDFEIVGNNSALEVLRLVLVLSERL